MVSGQAIGLLNTANNILGWRSLALWSAGSLTIPFGRNLCGNVNRRLPKYTTVRLHHLVLHTEHM